jgi:N-acetylglutamate synthase
VDAAALARLEHENMVEALWMAATQAPGARVERSDGVVLFATGLPLRLFNQVIVDGESPSPRAIADAVAITRDRGDRFLVNLRAGTDDACLPLMDELGLVKVSEEPWMPGMALHPLSIGTAPDSPDHEIRRVTSPDGVRDHILTAAAGFEMPTAWLEAVVSESLASDPVAALYVGYEGGLPVTTGLGIRTGPTIGAYNIATIPTARRRGFAEAMTRRIVADGAAAGCDVAVLQASDMGFAIYERIGFRTVVDYVGFVDPASLATG